MYAYTSRRLKFIMNGRYHISADDIYEYVKLIDLFKSPSENCIKQISIVQKWNIIWKVQSRMYENATSWNMVDVSSLNTLNYQKR